MSGSAGREDEAAGTWPALFFSAPRPSRAAVHSRCRACCCAVSTVTQSSLPTSPTQPSLEKVTSFKFSRRHLNHSVVAGRPKPCATTPKGAQTKEPLQRDLFWTKKESQRTYVPPQRSAFSAEQSPWNNQDQNSAMAVKGHFGAQLARQRPLTTASKADNSPLLPPIPPPSSAGLQRAPPPHSSLLPAKIPD